MPNIDPTYENTNSYKELFDMIDKKAKTIIKNDAWFQHRQVAKQAIADGLIRKKTDDEIADELKSKPWLKVNKIIRKNEQQ
jgi:hypothetical protein